MKKNGLLLAVIVCSLSLVACGGGKQSAASVAKKWCDLNARVHNAPDGGPEYGRAKQAREKYEKEIETKYRDDKAFWKEVEDEIEKCEPASEGR